MNSKSFEKLPHHLVLYTVFSAARTRHWWPDSFNFYPISWLIVKFGILDGETYHQSQISIREWTVTKASMRWWCRGINRLIITKKPNLHSLNYHFHSFRSKWLQCNKIRTVEMVWFFLIMKESDRTKQQDGRGWCCGEGDRVGPSIAVFFMVEVIRWRRRRSSWCRSIMTRFFIFWPRRNWYVLYGRLSTVKLARGEIAVWVCYLAICLSVLEDTNSTSYLPIWDRSKQIDK